MIIGLSGYARSGKNTAAEVLVKHAGFTRLSFAGPMKEALYHLNPLITIGGMRGVNLSSAIDNLGWEAVKDDSPEVRGLLQRMGTEVGREMFGEDFWVKQAMAEAKKYENVVFSDVRFINEAQAIQSAMGEVWRIERPGITPPNNHISEHQLDTFAFNAIIRNSDGLDKLEFAVLQALEFFGE